MSVESPLKVRIKDLPTDRRLALPQVVLHEALAGLPVEFHPEPGEPAPTGAMDLELGLSLEGSTVFGHGALTGTIPVACSRCLVVVQLPVDEKLHWTFLPHAKAAAIADDPEVELDEDDLDVMAYAGDEIDLAPPIREQIALAIPIAPLCREDCKGLCVQCGADHNLGPCACPPPVWPA